MDIDKAFTILQTFEGGVVVTHNPNDKGGVTKYGISQAAYPGLNIEDMSESTAKGIYGTDYYIKGNCGKLKDPAMQYVMFDTCVNMGIETATKILQEAAGAEMDGIFGAETLTKSDNVSVGDYMFLRESYDAMIVEHRQTQIEFLGGWTNRNKDIWQMYKAGKLQ